MDGKDSGLSADTLNQLKALDDLYDAETHGARVSLSQSTEWLKGKEPLAITPMFSELKVTLFINRWQEVAWMAHRLLPLVQPAGIRLAPEWAAKWEALDESFETSVMSITKQLGKPIGAAFCEFIHTKFPFTSKSVFPK